MNAKSVQCPSCGKRVSGRFCSHCGATVACPGCGAEVKAGARACHACGASLAAHAAPGLWSPQTVAPWAALIIALLALFVALTALLQQQGFGARTAPSFSSAGAAPEQAPDLSTMTPREAADRLFNRVMTASERGDTDEAARFAPMALQAYGMVGELDNDARYHVALIHLATGDVKNARVQLEQLQRSAPKHLLGFMLAHDIAERGGDKAGAARAYKGFLGAYDAEIAAARPEYEDHLSSIQRFHAAAEASAVKKK